MPLPPEWRNRLASAAAAQAGRLFLWVPVGLMPGILFYFSLPSEPWPYLGACLLLALAVLAAWLPPPRRLWAWPLLLAALGFTSAQLRAHRVHAPQITAELRYRQVEGTVAALEPMDDKLRLTLSRPIVEGLAPQATPGRIRISLRGEYPGLQPGERVRVKATLYPLPPPVQPGGYDFGRHFYFQSIGGTGYAMSGVERVEAPQPGAQALLARWRQAIGGDMRASMPAPEGSVAAALAVGEVGPIPQPVQDALRDAGLYHILSISGLHLSLASGIVFFSLRLLLSLWPAFALRVNAKKIAAGAALCAALFYLALAGSPVPAQRACIMVGFVLLAVLFDRQGISTRSLSFAALLILLVLPESLLGVSFQLSFAATLAIVALYERFGHVLRAEGGLARRIGRTLLATLLTSLVASLATAPFVLYHFNRLAVLGMLANLLVMPLAGFVIMPALILALLLLPFGLAGLAYVPLAFGIHAMLALAAWVAHLPAAILRLPSLTQGGVLMAGLGLLLLCLLRGRVRLAGAALMLASLLTCLQHRPVDMFISREVQQVVLRLDDGRYTALRGTDRAFAVENWLQSEGQDTLVPKAESGIPCAEDICGFTRRGIRVLVVTSPKNDAALDKACREAPDLLVAPRWLNAERCPEPKQRLGKRELEEGGPHALRFTDNGLEVARSYEREKDRRLWQPEIPD